MDLEKLQIANELAKQIEILKANIKNAEWTQSEQVKEREMYLHFNGTQPIYIPPSLFRTIGKLVLSELREDLKKAEEKFENL